MEDNLSWRNKFEDYKKFRLTELAALVNQLHGSPEAKAQLFADISEHINADLEKANREFDCLRESMFTFLRDIMMEEFPELKKIRELRKIESTKIKRLSLINDIRDLIHPFIVQKWVSRQIAENLRASLKENAQTLLQFDSLEVEKSRLEDLINAIRDSIPNELKLQRLPFIERQFFIFLRDEVQKGEVLLMNWANDDALHYLEVKGV